MKTAIPIEDSTPSSGFTTREQILVHLLSVCELSALGISIDADGNIVIFERTKLYTELPPVNQKGEQLTLPCITGEDKVNYPNATLKLPRDMTPEERDEYKRRLARERQRRCRERKKLKQLNGQQSLDGTTWVDSGQTSCTHAAAKSERECNEKITPVTISSQGHDCVTQKEHDTVMAKVHDHLRKITSEMCYNVWLADMKLLSLNDAEAVIKSGDFKARVLRNKHLPVIADAFEAAVGYAVTVTVLGETEAVSAGHDVTRDTPLSSIDEKNRDEGKNTTGAGAREVDNVCRVVFGWIVDEPTRAERSSVKRWLLWGFDANVMYLAYQLAEKYADRSPIGYMNVVLEGWHNAGIHDYESALSLFESRLGQQLRCTG